MADRFLGFSRMVFGFYGLFLFSCFLWRWGFLRLEYALHRLRINPIVNSGRYDPAG